MPPAVRMRARRRFPSPGRCEPAPIPSWMSGLPALADRRDARRRARDVPVRGCPLIALVIEGQARRAHATPATSLAVADHLAPPKVTSSPGIAARALDLGKIGVPSRVAIRRAVEAGVARAGSPGHRGAFPGRPSSAPFTCLPAHCRRRQPTGERDQHDVAGCRLSGPTCPRRCRGAARGGVARPRRPVDLENYVYEPTWMGRSPVFSTRIGTVTAGVWSIASPRSTYSPGITTRPSGWDRAVATVPSEGALDLDVGSFPGRQHVVAFDSAPSVISSATVARHGFPPGLRR